MELNKLKSLLGILPEDTGQDIALQFIMEDVTETILHYCHINKMPSGLQSTAYRMAIDLYRHDRPGDSSAPLAVSAITEGDTSTSFTNAADALAGGVLKNYQGQLNRYRRLVW